MSRLWVLVAFSPNGSNLNMWDDSPHWNYPCATIAHSGLVFIHAPTYVLVEAFLSPCLGCSKCTTLPYDKHGGFRYQTVVVNPDVEWQDCGVWSLRLIILLILTSFNILFTLEYTIVRHRQHINTRKLSPSLNILYNPIERKVQEIFCSKKFFVMLFSVTWLGNDMKS